MDSTVFRSRGAKAFAALLALTAWSGTLQATNLLTATPSTVALTCSTVTGPGASVNVVVKPVTALVGNATLVVGFAGNSGGVNVTAPQATTLNAANSATGLTYVVSLGAGCAGAATGAQTFHFTTGTGQNILADINITANLTVTSTATALVASGVTVTCARTNGGVYTPGPVQTVSVTSAATGGTPFTIDAVTSPPAAWLTVGAPSAASAGATPTTFTVVPAAGCGAFASGTTNTTVIHLLNAPAPDKLVTITLQVVPPSTLVAAPSPAQLSYVKGSGTAGYVDVRVTSATNPAPFFAVNTASLPIWLTVDSTTGTVPKNLRFSTTSVADSLPPGTYSTTIYLKVSGYADLALPISLLVNNKAPRLAVAEGTTRNISWTLGTPLPTPFITAVSSDSPIPYTAASGGTLAPIVSPSFQSGLAYSFGTQIPVTFNPLIFAAATPGSILTGTVTLTWGSPASTIVVTFNISIVSPGATLSALTPASVPTASSGQVFTVVMSGTGFVTSTDPTQKTKVGVVVSGAIVADTNISANVVNPSNIILTITVPVVADANLPFAPSGSGGSVVLGICNPGGGTCSIPTGTSTLTIGSGPIIQAITSASTFVQVSPGTAPNIAPYDMASMFGANFCSSAGTGCSNTQLLAGSPDPVALTYPTALSPDAVSATQRQLSVTFQTHALTPVFIANAPILFASNGQINFLVPGAVAASIGSPVDVVVNFGYGSGATLLKSAPFTVNIVAADPGIFTIGGDGQGPGAILNSNWTQIGATNPAGMRSTPADSDTVQLYVTGLVTPDSTGDNSAAGTLAGAVAPTDCVSITSYMTSLNTSISGALSTSVADGSVIQSALLNTHRLPPCEATNPTVTIGGVAATVLYAGFVPDTVAGLYQINATLPGSGAGPFTTASGASIGTITAPVQLPVVVTSASVPSQSGVTIWVAPRLKLTPPTGATAPGGLAGTVGVAWVNSNNSVLASEGTSPYRYALTSGLLPAGLTLNAATGAITGTPVANTAGSYTVTVTATDSANVPVTGSVTFTMTVAGGLFMTSTGVAPYNGVFGTPNATLTTVSASGGVYPYAYAITAPGTLPTGMTINASTGVIGISALTPAGTYHVTVTATDSTVGTPLTGTITFDVVVALHVVRTVSAAGSSGTPSTITTVSSTGQTGTVTYALDATTAGLGWVTITNGVVAITAGAPVTTISATVTATDGTVAPNAASAGTGSVTFNIVVN